MGLKEQIQSDFVSALKAKRDKLKNVLSLIKAKITEAEKAGSNKELSDQEIIKVLSGMKKQRAQSIEEYNSAGRTDLSLSEAYEMSVIESYMPSELSDEELGAEIDELLKTSKEDLSNLTRFQGQTIGALNKKYPGRVNVNRLKQILTAKLTVYDTKL